MHVTDDVEEAVLVPAVVPEGLALYLGGIYLLLPLEDEDVAKALLAERGYGAAHLLGVAAHHVRAEVSVRTRGVALLTNSLGQVKDDGHGYDVVLAGQSDKGLAALRGDICGVYHYQLAPAEALARD